jgi:hypothetical protein
MLDFVFDSVNSGFDNVCINHLINPYRHILTAKIQLISLKLNRINYSIQSQRLLKFEVRQ